MIELQNVNKRYPIENGGAVALKDCSLVINAGDFVSIIGTSGSGKTSLLNLIGCLDEHYTGHFIFDGKMVNGLSDDQRSALRNEAIGFVFQEFHLLDHLTVRENISLPLFFANKSENTEKSTLLKLASRLGIEEKLDQYPMHLSGGQRQRVAIARSLIRNPQLLLCDEPTGSLDAQTSAQFLTLLKELNQQGYTIVLITHDPNVAAAAQRQLRMQDGELQTLDTAQ